MAFSDKKVLLVEDNGVQALMIEQYIRDFNHTVVGTAGRAEKAVAMAEEHRPDLIIMDIFLDGDKTGIDAMQEIRARSDVPVIYISGNSDPYYVEKAKDTHFSHFLFKPINRTDLEEAVKHTFRTNGRKSGKKVSSSGKWSWPFSLFF